MCFDVAVVDTAHHAFFVLVDCDWVAGLDAQAFSAAENAFGRASAALMGLRVVLSERLLLSVLRIFLKTLLMVRAMGLTGRCV